VKRLLYIIGFLIILVLLLPFIILSIFTIKLYKPVKNKTGAFSITESQGLSDLIKK